MVGSDSGRVVILEYNPAKNELEKVKDCIHGSSAHHFYFLFCYAQVHQETFGKSGCRRIVPGQYIAADPKGRAAMIGGCMGNAVLSLRMQHGGVRGGGGGGGNGPFQLRDTHTLLVRGT